MFSKNNIKMKKERQGQKKYYYAIKKLSVGVASVAVGAGILFSSDAALAEAAEFDSADHTEAIDGKPAEVSVEQPVEEVPVEQPVVEEPAEAPATEETPVDQPVNEETADQPAVDSEFSVVDRTEEKSEAAPATTESVEEPKAEAVKADTEQPSEEAVDNDVTSDKQNSDQVNPTEEKVEKENQPVLRAASRANNISTRAIGEANPSGKNMNGLVTFRNIKFEEATSNGSDKDGKIDIFGYDLVRMSGEFTISDNVKPGDYFTFDYGNLVPGGFDDGSRDNFVLRDDKGGAVANHIYDPSLNRSTFVFTNYLNALKDKHGTFNQHLFPNRKVITDNGRYAVRVNLAGEIGSDRLTFNFYDEDKIVNKDLPIIEQSPINGAQNSRNSDEKTYRETIYINQVKNNYNPARVNIKADNYDVDKVYVYEVLDPSGFVPSAQPNYSDTSKYKLVSEGANKDNKLVIEYGKTVSLAFGSAEVPGAATVNFKDLLLGADDTAYWIDSSGQYIIDVHFKQKPGMEAGGQVFYDLSGKVYTDWATGGEELGGNDWNHSSYITNISDSSTVEGRLEQPGSFQDHHIGRVLDYNGNQIGDAQSGDGEVQSGTESEQYNTGVHPYFESNGFEFVEISNPVNNPTYNEDGAQATGNFEPGVHKEITYNYVKQPGRFQEHHRYETLDQNGNVIPELTETVDEAYQEGYSNESYSTGLENKEGYTFVRTENPVENPEYNTNGAATEGNYERGVQKEITYVYQRTQEPPVADPGSFIENHDYETVDADGKVISTDKELRGQNEQAGTPDEQYTTKERPEAGYELFKVSTTEENPGEPGEETPDKPGEETPDKPGEETPDKPGEETPDKPGEETPDKPGEETPDKPGEETPDKPGEETPDKPGEETPDKPGEDKPGEPGEETPSEPTPEQPVTIVPENPEQPNTPQTPVAQPMRMTSRHPMVKTPQRPQSAQAEKASALPNTGTAVAGAVVGVAAVLAGGLINFGKRRKK